MNCRRVREFIFLYTYNEAEAEEQIRVEVREHLHVCPSCARRLDATRKLLTLLKNGCTRAQAPAHLRKRILTSLPHRRAGLEESWD